MWVADRAQGQGKFVHVDGSYYEGEWDNSKANGRGVYVHVNGARYEGYWKNDLQHGHGVETWSDKSSFEGEYRAGKKQGRGIYKWADMSEYNGPGAAARLIGDRKRIDALTDRFDRIVVDQSANLGRWADLLQTTRERVPETYVYANNHYAGHGPETVRQLRALVEEPGS